MKLINLNKKRTEQLVFNKPGEYVVFLHNLSGKFTFELAAPHVEVSIFGLFTGHNADQFQIETVQHHVASDSWSNLLIKGVFYDKSKFNYQGLIRIEKSGQKSHAYQKNQNLIMSPHTFIESKPFLEILANDVFCTHGSTTGKLNQEELFYTKTRGLSQKQAEELLVDGFVNEIYDKIRQKDPSFTVSD